MLDFMERGVIKLLKKRGNTDIEIAKVRCPDFFGHEIGKVKQGFCVELCVLFMSSVSFVTNIGTQTQMVSCNLAKNESAHDCRKHQENNTDLYGHHGNQHITHTSSSFR